MSHKLGQFRDDLASIVIGFNSGDQIQEIIHTFTDSNGNEVDVSTWDFGMSIRNDSNEVIALTDSDFSATGSNNAELQMTVSGSDTSNLDRSTTLRYEGILKATNTSSGFDDPYYVKEVKFYPQNFVNED